MAEPAQASAQAEDAGNLHDDPVTGEKISKSERTFNRSFNKMYIESCSQASYEAARGRSQKSRESCKGPHSVSPKEDYCE
jgi:hypothetical protein